MTNWLIHTVKRNNKSKSPKRQTFKFYACRSENLDEGSKGISLI